MNRAYPVILLLFVAVGLSSCGLMLKYEVRDHKKLYQEMHEGRFERERNVEWQLFKRKRDS